MKSCYDIEILSKQSTIKDLIAKKAEAESRAIYHMTVNKNNLKSLDEAKKEIHTITSEFRSEEQRLRSEIETTRALQSAKREEYILLEDQKERIEKDKAAEAQHLNATIDILKRSLDEKTDTINKMKEQLEIFGEQIAQQSASTAVEQPNDYEKLERQFINVCDKNKNLLSENRQAIRKLRYYADIENEMKQHDGDDNTMTIQERISKMTMIYEENKKLIDEVAQLKGERDSWKLYLDIDLDQPPATILRELSKKTHISDSIKLENKKLQKRLTDMTELISELEAHIDNLKQIAADNQAKADTTLVAKEYLQRREKTFQLQIDLLKNHLGFYEQQEKTQSAETYDEIKSKRIVELEQLLAQYKKTVDDQCVELSNLVMSKPTPNVISSGPYDSLSSGKKIVEILSRIIGESREQCQELAENRAENSMLKKELSSASRENEADIDNTQTANNKKEDENDADNTTKDNEGVSGDKIKTPSEPGAFEGRILELVENPDTTKRAARIELVTQLKNENAQLLKARLSTVNNDESFISIPKITVESLQKDIDETKEVVETKQKRIDRLLVNWNLQNEKQNEIIQALLGYKVSIRPNGIVRLENGFVSHTKLAFYVNLANGKDEAKLRVVGSMKDFYMDTLLHGLYESYIEQDKNIPAFLNAAGQELYIQYKSEKDEIQARELEEEGEVMDEDVIAEE
ncbi:hypothetical protein BY458DRAFT_472064 [Sporodiniella umbellata]|nr:hypothetical protein BY458DRAFT_472064 [Sporodiniella umbellata]